MKKFFLTCILFPTLFFSVGFAQHFIGKSKDEIKTQMEETRQEFFFSKEVETEKWHFLKFENKDNTKTYLFIFDEDGKCDYTKLMCDYSLLKSMEDELSQKYEYQKDMTWIDYSSDPDSDYLIELEKREWFFTVKTTRIKN